MNYFPKENSNKYGFNSPLSAKNQIVILEDNVSTKKVTHSN